MSCTHEKLLEFFALDSSSTTEINLFENKVAVV